jgi:glycosyltransferase involved in cell wall biosynthesis
MGPSRVGSNTRRYLRILYIATAYPRSESDAITPWLVETVDRLRAMGHHTTVFTSSYCGLGNQVLHGSPVVRFRYFFQRWEKLTHDETAVDRVRKGLLNKLLALSYMAFGSLAIWRLCRRENYDIIHVHWPLPHAAFGWIAARACRAPMVISFHGVELMWVLHGFKVMRPFVRWAIRAAAAITANSTHTVNAIQSLQNRPVDIVPFGAAVGNFPEAPHLSISKKNNILFVGRLVERKGIPYLVEATAILAREMQVHLDIVGSGPEEGRLRDLVRAQGYSSFVTMHGNVSADELHRHYSTCNVFVLPAIVDSKGDTEGLGVVIIEAMHYRRPVVASGVGGIVDLVIDGETGLRTPPADSAALASALRRVLTDESLASRLAQGGFEHVRSSYSWPGIIARLDGIYQRVATPQNRRLHDVS